MDEDNFLVYEQDEVQLCTQTEEEGSQIGKLRIVEKARDTFIEWVQTLDDSSDGEWAVIGSPAVSFSSNKITDSVKINNCKKNVVPVSILVRENLYCRVTERKKKLEILDKEKFTLATFQFHKAHSEYFLDVLKRYIYLRDQDSDETFFLLQNKDKADNDDKLAALNLVPRRRSPGENFKPFQHSQWVADAPKRVLGFLHNMKKDPYNTTVSTFNKIYEVVLYDDYEEQSHSREETEDVSEFLQRISGIDDLEPGFEILTKREQLADRPDIERLSPLSHEEFKSYVEADGKILRIGALKERIFRGGIHPNLRPELWCYLLGVYEWDSRSKEREENRRLKEHEYFVMKQQWKTLSDDQERNFTGYRERKSLIEKDVNRTDRNHPFYEGETNTNIEMLNDVLMTYIMYNFDLGYVQGMSDLLAPILYVTQNESLAFWCFVGYMQRVYRNFDLDQAGMKQQLSDLTQVLKIIDPEFVSFLEAQDSSNLYFCFRWLLVRFKRELNYTDTLRLWEVFWTDHLCVNFHLCIAAAILDTERDEIVEKKFSFTDVLKHINGLSLRIDLDNILKKAEAIYVQLSQSPSVPNTVRTILNIPLNHSTVKSLRNTPVAETWGPGLPGRAERVKTTDEGPTTHSTSTSKIGNPEDAEVSFERGVSHSFL